MGWVLFRQGKLSEALKTLEQAYKIKADPEIAAHLSEVLWTLDRKDEARQLLKEASKANPDNEVLAGTIETAALSFRFSLLLAASLLAGCASLAAGSTAASRQDSRLFAGGPLRPARGHARPGTAKFRRPPDLDAPEPQRPRAALQPARLRPG